MVNRLTGNTNYVIMGAHFQGLWLRPLYALYNMDLYKIGLNEIFRCFMACCCPSIKMDQIENVSNYGIRGICFLSSFLPFVIQLRVCLYRGKTREKFNLHGKVTNDTTVLADPYFRYDSYL